MGRPRESTSSVMDTSDLDQSTEKEGNFLTFEEKVLTFEEKKRAVETFRKLTQNVQSIDLNDEDIGEHLDLMKANVVNQNECMQQIGINETMTHDAKCMTATSEVSYQLVKKFNPQSKFNRKDFLKQLRQRVLINSRKAGIATPDEDNSRWVRFEQLFPTGLAFTTIHHHVPGMIRTFLSPESRPEKKAPVRRTQRQNQTATATQPTTYDASNMANNEDESEKRLRYIHGRLTKLQLQNPTGTPLIQSAVNPQSFSTTVENFFNIAFLARQKKIKIDVPEDPDEDAPEPLVKAYKDKKNPNEPDDSEEEEQDQNKQAVQSVLTFDYDAYESLINSLEITRSAFK